MTRFRWLASISVLTYLGLPSADVGSLSIVWAKDSRFEIIGLIRNLDGSPATGEVVYFATVTDSRVSMSFRYEDDKTTGVSNPHTKTDMNGRF